MLRKNEYLPFSSGKILVLFFLIIQTLYGFAESPVLS